MAGGATPDVHREGSPVQTITRTTTTRLIAALTAALLLAALGVTGAGAQALDEDGCFEFRAATSDEADDAVELCQSEVFFKPASTKAGNLAGPGVDDIPSWDGDAPGTSVTAGGGGGYATLRAGELLDAPRDPLYKPTFEGSFTGPLDTLAVDLYLFSPVYQATGTEFPLLVIVEIDGKTITFIDDEEVDVAIGPGGDAAGLIRFAITDVYELMERRKLDLDPDAEHTMEISVTARYFGDGNSVFVYDTTEVPSGMTFNATDLDGYTVIQ